MSHTTDLKLIIKSLDTLEKAVKFFGGELVRDAKEFVYFAGKKEKCDHAIKFPNTNGYEIGVIKRPDGKGFDLRADFWGGHLARVVGQDAGLLKQRNAVETAKKYYKDYRLTFTTKENGDIIIDASN